MAEFKKWISYLYAYSGEIKGKNVGFARVEVRDDRCRLTIGVKGAYGCDARGLEVGLYIRTDDKLTRIPIGSMRIREGCGEFSETTEGKDLFGTGVPVEQCGGLWLISQERETIYLSSWEKSCLDIREFLTVPQNVEREEAMIGSTAEVDTGATAEINTGSAAEEEKECCSCSVKVCPRRAGSLEQLPQPSLWESLSRYYPKTAPELRQRGVELLKIRPADIRYLPRGLWYYGSNSFLLHGYYHYKYLVLGRICTEEGLWYLLGVPGVRNDRERFSADMFGFRYFLPLTEQEGYWYTQIHL